MYRSKNRRQTTSDSPPLSELSTRSQSTTETGGQHNHNQPIKSNISSTYINNQGAIANIAEGQVTALTQTPSSYNHHHHSHHHKEHQSDPSQHQSFPNQQRHHRTYVQHSSRRNSSGVCGAVGYASVQQQQHPQQLHLDPLNAVALPNSGILSASQQMAQPGLSQHQQFTSASMAGHGTYQQASMIQRDNAMNESGTRSLSTAPKHSISHNLAGTLQYVPSGKLKLVSMNNTLHL